MKKFIVNILTVLCLTVGIGVSNNAVSQNAPQKTQPTTTSQAAVYSQPLEILNNAQKYLNKPVKIQAKFNRFTHPESSLFYT